MYSIFRIPLRRSGVTSVLIEMFAPLLAAMVRRCLTDCKNHPTDLACVDDEDQCDSQPCENGATCYDAKNAFVCECPDGFNGEKSGRAPLRLRLLAPCGLWCVVSLASAVS